ncbi:MAG: hypothetical protein RR840_02065 [Clostridium sp.]
MRNKNMIIINGWAAPKFIWHDFINLASNDYIVHFINVNDYDNSNLYTDKVSSYINNNRLTNITLVGWSLGSMVLIKSLPLIKNKIDFIVLFAPTLRFTICKKTNYIWGWNSKLVFLMQKRLITDMDNTLLDFYSKLFTPKESKYKLELFTHHTSHNKYDLHNLISGLDFLINEDLRCTSTIHTKALIIHGDSDEICPLNSSKLVNSIFNNSKTLVTNNSGHAPFYTMANICYEFILNNG